MVYEPLASGKHCCFLNATLTLSSLYCRPNPCIHTAMTQPLLGCRVLSCCGFSACVKGSQEESVYPRLGKGGAVTQGVHLPVSPDHHRVLCHAYGKILVESNEVIVHLIFHT